MKTWVSMVGAVALALASCQTAPVDTPAGQEAMDDKPADYQALPGQAATSSTPSETATAFEFAAAALAAGNTQPPSTGAAEPPPVAPRVAPPALAQQLRLPEHIPAAPPIPDPRPVDDAPTPTADGQGSASITAKPTGSSSSAGYALQITNGTSGRLFVEVQDDSGNIFPFGFMYAGQRIASRPQENRPISGQLQVIIRDPDRTGAPELRRYRVSPPPEYNGRTVGVTILPGGRYRASLDGTVYYRSPDPKADQPAE